MQKRNNPLELKVRVQESEEEFHAPVLSGENAAKTAATDTYAENKPVPTDVPVAAVTDTRATEKTEPIVVGDTRPATPKVEDLSLPAESPYSAEDYAMATRFSFVGRISRKTNMVRVSDELCRVVKSMHPDSKIAKLVEDALLTRLFLEDRDAFDTLDILIEDKGGHIKC